MGTVGILNVGAGDTKLTFDNSNPDETAKAARIVKDMLRRGFALLIEVGSDDKGPLYRRAHDFDENTHEYIIAGTVSDQEGNHHDEKPAGAPRKGRPRKAASRIPAARATAVAVARTAGG